MHVKTRINLLSGLPYVRSGDNGSMYARLAGLLHACVCVWAIDEPRCAVLAEKEMVDLVLVLRIDHIDATIYATPFIYRKYDQCSYLSTLTNPKIITYQPCIWWWQRRRRTAYIQTKHTYIQLVLIIFSFTEFLKVNLGLSEWQCQQIYCVRFWMATR